MTRQIINIGTGPDSYTGDNLRTAFTKVNDNFAQLYAGNVGANTTINVLTANTVSTNGNVNAGNVLVQYQVIASGNISAPIFLGNGRHLTGVLVSANLGNLSIGGPNNLTISGSVAGNIVLDPAGDGNVSIVSDVIPGANVTYNLGSSTRQWKDLWLSNSTLYLGGFPVTVSNTGALSVNGSPVTSSYGNANVTAFLPTYSGLLGGTLSTVSQPNITAVGTLTSLTATNDITTTSGRFIGNGSGLTAITGANVNGTVANATYAVTAQFVTGLTGANVTTALGYVPLNSNSANTYSNTTVAAFLPTYGGNVGNGSGYFFGNGSQLTGLPATYSNATVASYLPTYTGNIAGNIVKNGYAWNFGTDSNLTLPAGGVLLVSGGITATQLNISPAPYLSGFGTISSQTMTASGNITGNYILGNGSQLTGLGATYSNANVSTYLSQYDGSINFTSSTGGIANVDTITVLDYIRSDSYQFSNGVSILSNISTGRITLTNGAVIKDTAGDAVAFGQNAGLTNQGDATVAVGLLAGNTTQGIGAVAVGAYAGSTTQGVDAVAVGDAAGYNTQGNNAIAIGASAGTNTQGKSSVAIGQIAGRDAQGNNSVAVGFGAGYNTQGANAVAIGSNAGTTNQANNSIIINATGNALEQTRANTFTVAPVRNDVANIGEVVFYNTTSKEITYGNTISVAGNISAGNVNITGNIVDTGALSIITGSNGNIALIPNGTGVVTASSAFTAVGNITGGNISTTGTIYGNVSPGAAGTISNAVGYLGVPQNSQSTNYTLALADQGRHIYLTANSNITIPANSSVSFPIGSAISVVNGPNVQSNVLITTDTLYLAANGATGTRSISTYGMYTLVKVTNTVWYINGSGIT
jgi:hypothetical protein